MSRFTDAHRGPLASIVAKALNVEPDPDRCRVTADGLTVGSSHRGRPQLLCTAAAEAVRQRLTPALDVVATYAAAIALYERAGWGRIGTITGAMPDGDRVDEYVYVSPT